MARFAIAPALALVCVSLVACGGGEEEATVPPAEDVGTDAVADTPVDSTAGDSAVADTNADVQANADAQADANANADAQADANANADAQANPDAQANADATPDSGPPCPVLTPALLDDFTATTFSPRWTLSLPSTTAPSVTAAGGKAVLVNRGYLVTSADYDPSRAPVRVTGEWTFTSGDGDLMQILTRSSGLPGNAPGETTAGIECALAGVPGTALQPTLSGRGASVTDAVSSGSLTLAIGDTVTFDVFDDGDLVLCTVRKKGSTQLAAAVANSTFQPAANKVTFHNKNRTTTDLTASLDVVVVEQGIPRLPLNEWRFEDGVGVVARPLVSTINGSMGSSTGLVPALLGNGVFLPGNPTNYVDFGPNGGKLGTKDFTVSLWFQAPANTTTRDLLGTRNTVAGGQWFGLRLNGGQLVFEVSEDATGLNYTSATSTGGLADDAWHHVAAVRRGVRVELWVDGVLSNVSAAAAGTANVSGTGNLQLGRTAVTAADTERFSGTVDHLRIYDSALGRCEIPVLAATP